MNVYQLRPIGICTGGMALVAAPTFAIAKNEYLLNGAYGEMYYFKDFVFDERYSQPIEGLEWHGDAGIICESIYVE